MANEKKKAVWYVVNCNIHGARSGDPNINPCIKVGARGHRSEKTKGCPFCNSEKKKV